jgi:hypothetical protein
MKNTYTTNTFTANDFGLLPSVTKIAFYIDKKKFHEHQEYIKSFCKKELTAYLFYDINVLYKDGVIKAKAIEFRDVNFDFNEFKLKLQDISLNLCTPIFMEYGCQFVAVDTQSNAN